MKLCIDGLFKLQRGMSYSRVAAGLISVALALCLISTSAEAVNPRPTRKVALEGETAPGTGGQTFNNFDEPFVNNSGDVVFVADYNTATQMGIFLSHGGTLSAVAVSGQVVPGVGTIPNAHIGSFQIPGFDGPSFNKSSTVAFVVRGITGGSTTAAVFQQKLGGPLTVLAKQGDPAIGAAGAVFDSFDDIAENNNGDVAFIATYTSDGGTTFQEGVFLATPADHRIRALALAGDALPGTGGTIAAGDIESGVIDGPALNDYDFVSFLSDVSGGPGGFGGSAFSRQPAARPIRAFLLKGDPAPASTGGTIADLSFGRPGLNNQSTAGFKIEISGGSAGSAIVTKTIGGAPVVCLKAGDAAPGTTGTFVDEINPPAINQAGLLSIESQVTGDATVTQGIFTCKNGVVNAIALQGDPKPGTAGTFGSNLSDASLSDDGHVAFIDTSSTRGVFVGPNP